MNSAWRESLKAVKETCPVIDKGLAALEEIIKEQTYNLRNALITEIELRWKVEQELSVVRESWESSKDEIEEFKQEIKELKQEIEELKASLLEIA